MFNPFHELLPTKESPPNEADSFLVCGMFTSNYAEKALKLEQSLIRFDLPYVLYEIPSIHSSITPNGESNSQFNKPKFIDEMLGRYKLPVLYIDVDFIIEKKPELIYEIANQSYDFGIFNWLSPARNDAYVPINISGFEVNRFYTYSHGIFAYDEKQLRCSGGVQFWGNTPQARKLLNRWIATIEANPYAPDDVSLDFSYNNNPEKYLVRSFWLPKSYARIAFWIFDMPIINHPAFPTSVEKFQSINLKDGEFWVDGSQVQEATPLFYIQPGTFLDIHRDEIVMFQNGVRLKIAKNSFPIYV